MAKANTEPLSGMRDFLALDVLRRNHVIGVIERVYQSYGFEPLETPTMERLSTLLGKYGEEGDQLIFRVLKRGEKLARALGEQPTQDSIADAGLRYDLTVPLARVVAEHRDRLPRYYKRYQIQPVYRADRPAKGRFREFYQCDVDVVGSASMAVEADVLAAGAQILTELGFTAADAFALRLNHRGVLSGLMQHAGVPAQREDGALIAIDKLDKVGLDGVRAELAQRGIADDAAGVLLRTIEEAPRANTDVLAWLGDLLEDSEQGSRAVAELRDVVAYSAHGPAAERIRVDPYLARGLSYYTGPIFEIEFPGLAGSGGGGGRYDHLIGMFSGRDIPACGFSLGLERILLIMEERGLFPEHLAGEPQLLVTQYDATTAGASIALAQALRTAGLRADLYPDFDRYGRQLKYAEERRIRFALMVGPREIESGVVAVKDLAHSTQADVPLGEIVAYMQQLLAG